MGAKSSLEGGIPYQGHQLLPTAAGPSPRSSINRWDSKVSAVNFCEIYSHFGAFPFSQSTLPRNRHSIRGEQELLLCRIYKPASVFPAINWELDNSFHATSAVECTALSWRQHSPDLPPYLLVGNGKGGAAIWQYSAKLAQWWLCREFRIEDEDEEVNVSSVSWAPQLGRPFEQVAIASGMKVHIFNFSSVFQDPKEKVQYSELLHPA